MMYLNRGTGKAVLMTYDQARDEGVILAGRGWVMGGRDAPGLAATANQALAEIAGLLVTGLARGPPSRASISVQVDGPCAAWRNRLQGALPCHRIQCSSLVSLSTSRFLVSTGRLDTVQWSSSSSIGVARMPCVCRTRAAVVATGWRQGSGEGEVLLSALKAALLAN